VESHLPFKHFASMILGCLLVVSASTASRAELVLTFGQGSTIGVTNFNADAGSNLVLDVYVTQRGLVPSGFGFDIGDYRLSSGDSTRGLASFLFDMQITNAGQGAAQTTVLPASVSTFVYGTGLSDQTSENLITGSSVRYVGFAPPNGPDTLFPIFVAEPFALTANVPTAGTVASNSLRLGALTVNVSTDASGPYSLNLSNPGSIFGFGLGTSTLGPFVVVSGSSATLNVAAVPEPTSLVLLGMIGLAGVASRWRKRQPASAA